MSRIGKIPVSIPDKVKVQVNGSQVTVEGPKGRLVKNFDSAVKITVKDGEVIVEPVGNSRHARIMWGTARSIIAGMVSGVVTNYSKDLEIQGVGFKASLKGAVLDLALGYSHPISYKIPQGIVVQPDGSGTKINVSGADKHMVGQVAADIKSYYPVEPYKGKGVRLVGQYVRKKEGKKTA